ncbi:hypothetical protein SANTM175S_06983 [Streptomyces antimycoticus]
MIDTEKIQPPGKVMPKLMRPGIRIGKPLDFSRYHGMDGDRFDPALGDRRGHVRDHEALRPGVRAPLTRPPPSGRSRTPRRPVKAAEKEKDKHKSGA